jgi:hypothetical protein
MAETLQWTVPGQHLDNIFCKAPLDKMLLIF